MYHLLLPTYRFLPSAQVCSVTGEFDKEAESIGFPREINFSEILFKGEFGPGSLGVTLFLLYIQVKSLVFERPVYYQESFSLEGILAMLKVF